MDSVTTNMSSLTSEFSNELVIENIQSTSLENFNPIEIYQNLTPLPYTIKSQNNGINIQNDFSQANSNFESFNQNFKKFNSFSQNSFRHKQTPRLASLRSTAGQIHAEGVEYHHQLKTEKFSLDLNNRRVQVSANLFEDLGRITERSKESTDPYEESNENFSNRMRPVSKISSYNIEKAQSHEIKDDSIDVLSSNFSTFRDFQNSKKDEVAKISKSKETSKKKFDNLKQNFWKSEDTQMIVGHHSDTSTHGSNSNKMSTKMLGPFMNTFGPQSEKNSMNSRSLKSNYESDENRKMTNPVIKEDSYKGTKKKLFKKIKEENEFLNESIKKYTETISNLKSKIAKKRARLKKMRNSIPQKNSSLQELENEINMLQNFNDKMVDHLSTTLETIPLTTKRSDITRKNSSIASENPIFKFSLENKENSRSVNNIDFSSLLSLGNGSLGYEKPFGMPNSKKMYGTLDSGLKRAKANGQMKVKGMKVVKEKAKKKFPVLQDKLNKSLVDFFLIDDTGEDSSYYEENNNNSVLDMK